jgi:tetratricopeptide (TPR) repeat protein
MSIQALPAALLMLTAAASAQTAQALPELTSPLGATFYSLPDEKGGVAEARKNLAADPKNPALLMKLEAAQVSVWQDREAVATCTRALKLTPESADILTERGHRELPLRDFKHALADLSHAVSLDPKKMDAYYHLGLAHYFLGEFEQAGAAFRHAVDLAPNLDERINSTNWLYASLRRDRRETEAARALAQITPQMKNTADHSLYYLNLVRFFQGRMSETAVLPSEPNLGESDNEVELRFDTVAYGVGNWHLYNNDATKAREYFARIVKGHVWVTWGFIGAEVELAKGRRK